MAILGLWEGLGVDFGSIFMFLGAILGGIGKVLGCFFEYFWPWKGMGHIGENA